MEVLCHDIKTERKEVSGGLPDALKVVPLLFYVSVVVCTGLFVSFELQRKAAVNELQTRQSQALKFNQVATAVTQERKGVETANAWATEVAKWLEGAHNLQPLLVALGRGVGESATIAEVILARNSEIASQIQFTLKLDGVNSQVLDQTLEGIRKLDFRAYSAQQQKEGEGLDYNAILVYQPRDDIAAR